MQLTADIINAELRSFALAFEPTEIDKDEKQVVWGTKWGNKALTLKVLSCFFGGIATGARFCESEGCFAAL